MTDELTLKRKEKEILLVLYQYYPLSLTISEISDLILKENLPALTDEQIETYTEEMHTDILRKQNSMWN